MHANLIRVRIADVDKVVIEFRNEYEYHRTYGISCREMRVLASRLNLIADALEAQNEVELDKERG